MSAHHPPPLEPAPYEQGSRWRRTFDRLFGIDTRSLAALRIGLAGMILFDLADRARWLEAFYTDFGLYPRADVIRLYETGDSWGRAWRWSLHMLSGEWWLQAVLFLIAAFFALQLLVGYRTRLAAFASWVLLTSLQHRNPMILQGGDVMLRCALFWAMFLPLGARASVDAALTARHEPWPRQAANLASFGLLLQIVLLYVSTAALKTDPIWTEDHTAVWFALTNSFFSTDLGLAVARQDWLCRWLTIAALQLEWYGVLLAFVPYRIGLFRTLCVLMFWGFHLGLAATMRLGNFPYVAVVCWCAFLPGGCWDLLTRWLKLDHRRRIALTIYYDAGCRFCLEVSLLLRTLLLLDRVELRPGTDAPELQQEIDQRQSWIVLDRPAGTKRYGFDGLTWLMSRSPVAWPLAWPLRLPLLRHAGELAYRLVARHRPQAARWLPFREPQPPRFRLDPASTLLLAVLAVYITLWNAREIDVAWWEQHGATREHNWLGHATGLAQSWPLFAPFPTRIDGWYVLEGRLVNGTTVDLWKVVDGRWEAEGDTALYLWNDELPWSAPTDPLTRYHNEDWQKLFGNLRNDWGEPHRGQLIGWLRRQWQRRLDAAKAISPDEARRRRLRSIHVWFMRSWAPAPDEPLPVPKKRLLWRWYR